MPSLTIEIEDAWFPHKSDRKERWIGDINGLCKLLENFLRTEDAMEQIRFDVLDRPGVAVKR
ncbi:hypothetical protein AAVH_22212 [Aphelenchoides avenae]|nr:hypothetical protein AAVH_22212 [Aphelenchus avenae]